MKVSGNDLFVTAMKKEGVDTIFAYPGGMVVNLLDALHDCHGIGIKFSGKKGIGGCNQSGRSRYCNFTPDDGCGIRLCRSG